MSKVTVRVGLPVYVVLFVVGLPFVWALLYGISNFLSHGYFHPRQDDLDLLTFAIVLVVLIFLGTSVFPAYRAVISKRGVETICRIAMFRLTLLDLSSGKVTWNDVVSLDYFNIGFLWGLTLNFAVNGKRRMVLLNRSYTNHREALRITLENLPDYKITDEARRKLERKGMLKTA